MASALNAVRGARQCELLQGRQHRWFQQGDAWNVANRCPRVTWADSSTGCRLRQKHDGRV